MIYQFDSSLLIVLATSIFVGIIFWRRGLLGKILRPGSSLRTSLVVPFVLIVIAAVGLTGYLSFRNGQQSVSYLVSRMQRETITRIEQELDDLLAIPHRVNQVNANAITQGQVNVRDYTALRAYFLDQAKIFQSITSFGWGNDQGEFLGAGRRPDGTFDTSFYNKLVDDNYYYYTLDAQGNLKTLLQTVPDYDARTRSWYTAAVSAGKATWSPPYIYVSGTHLGISAVLPIYDRAGKLQSVVLTAITMEQLGNYLKNLPVGETGQTFIVERSGMLIASSLGEKPLRQDGANSVRIQATESASPIVRAAAQALIAQANLEQLDGVQHWDVALNGLGYSLETSIYSDMRGLEWIIVTAIPDSDFMGPIYINNVIMTGLAFGILIVAILVGMFTANRITRPISALNDAARRLAAGEWQGAIVTDRIDEIGGLTHSFNQMADQIQESIATLEHRVANRTSELSQANERLSQESAARQRVADALRSSEARYRLLADDAPLAVAVVDLGTAQVVYINRRAEKLFGIAMEQAVGTSALGFYVNPDERNGLIKALREHGYVADFETRLKRGDGTDFWASITSHISTFENRPAIHSVYIDITTRKQAQVALHQANQQLRAQLDEIQILQTQLREQAIRDSLTGLFNRRYLDEMLAREIASAMRDAHPIGIVMMDIDHFKSFNDAYGHHAGDLMLQAMGDLLRTHTRQMDIVCRYGGEEFVVIMPGTSLDATMRRAEELRHAFALQRIQYGSHVLQTTISVGVAMFPNHINDSDSFLRAADDALYLAKQAGRNCVMAYRK